MLVLVNKLRMQSAIAERFKHGLQGHHDIMQSEAELDLNGRSGPSSA